MTNDPDRIQSEIEQTRADLSHNVDAIRDRVSPGAMAGRQKERMRGAVTSVKERVMGATSGMGETGSSAASSIGRVPAMAQERTEGNPLAAGLVAFGLGWLVSTVIPASKPERQAAAQIKEQAGGMAQQVSEVARDVADDMREPAKQAADSVRSTATEATQSVREEGTSAARDVRDEGQTSAENLKPGSN